MLPTSPILPGIFFSLLVGFLSLCTGTVRAEGSRTVPLTERSIDLLGVYIDTTSQIPHYRNEVILFRREGKLEGVWSEFFSKEKRGYPFGAYPLDSLVLDSLGTLSFRVVWAMYWRGEGWRRMHHYFRGRMFRDRVEGAFTSDWPVLTPPPIKAHAASVLELGDDPSQYVLDRRQSADRYQESLNRVLQCQEDRKAEPHVPIHVVGSWSVYGSDGEHEWGYDVVLFRMGHNYLGWLEDYASLIGDGGIRYPLTDVHYDAARRSLECKAGAEGPIKARIQSRRLLLTIRGQRAESLREQKLPSADWVWGRYLELSQSCGRLP